MVGYFLYNKCMINKGLEMSKEKQVNEEVKKKVNQSLRRGDN